MTTDWIKHRQVFLKTYSRKSGYYKPWSAGSFTPMPIIDTRREPRNRHGSLQTPQNTPASSETTTTDSDSSLFSDNTQFLSLSGEHTKTVIYDGYSSTDVTSDEVTKKSPNAPYHYKQRQEYSIIIEDSEDMEQPTGYIRPPAVQHKSKNVTKSNMFGRRLPATKMMKDSLQHVTQSTDILGEGSFSDSEFLTFSSSGEVNTLESSTSNDELPAIGHSSAENPMSSSESDHPQALREDQDDLPDIEVMRDAPPLKTHRKNVGKKGDLASSLKISAMKLHPSGGRVQTIAPHRSKDRKRDRKNSTFKEDHRLAKPIQDVTFFEDISHISGGQTTSEDLTEDDSVSTLKGTIGQCSPGEGTLRDIPLNIQKAPVITAVKGTPPGYIRTPKKHNIKRIPTKKVPLSMEPDSAKQVSFSKTNQESLYLPGSKIKDVSPSEQLLQLSPSISILKKAVASWKLKSPKEKENYHGAKTSTPLWKRRSRNKKSEILDLSFGVSAVPLPSYDDLVVNSMPIKKPAKETTAASSRFEIPSESEPPPSNDEDQVPMREKPEKTKISNATMSEMPSESEHPPSNDEDHVGPREKPGKTKTSDITMFEMSSESEHPPSNEEDQMPPREKPGKTKTSSITMPGSTTNDVQSIIENSVTVGSMPKDISTTTGGLSTNKEKENDHGAKTSTPLWKRRSRNKKSELLDLSFGVSAVPLPSYDDLVVTSMPIKKPAGETTAAGSKSEMPSESEPPPSNDEDQVPMREKPEKTKISNATMYEMPSESEHPPSNGEGKVAPIEKPGKPTTSSVILFEMPPESEHPHINDEGQPAPTEKPGKTKISSITMVDMSADPMLPDNDHDDELIMTSVQKGSPVRSRKSSTIKHDVRAGQLPSYQNEDLIITSLSINKKTVSGGTPSNKKLSHESPKPGLNATPSKQLKRESPRSDDIPARPTKRRAMRLSSSSPSVATVKSHQQKKKLEYKSVAVGPEICIITRLPDSLFLNPQQSTKNLPYPLRDGVSFSKDVCVDTLPAISDTVFSMEGCLQSSR